LVINRAALAWHTGKESGRERQKGSKTAQQSWKKEKRNKEGKQADLAPCAA
jgi:hypothetical protein